MKWLGSNEGCITVADWLGGRDLPPPPMFGGFLKDQSLTIVTGSTHVGKSLLLSHLILCLDLGKPLFGRYPAVSGPKRVLALLQDSPRWDYAEQFRKMGRGFGLNRGVAGMLRADIVVNRQIDVLEPGFRAELERIHAEDPFDVLVLDALWTFHCVNENDMSQLGLVAKRLKWVRDALGASVIFTHHTRKMNAADSAVMSSNEKTRGSRVVVDASDFHMHLTRKGDVVRVELPKARGEDESLTEFKITEVEHPDGVALQLIAAGRDETTLGIVLDLLRAPQKRGAISEALRATNPKLTSAQAYKLTSNTLSLLQAAGKVERVAFGIWQVRGGNPPPENS